MAAPRPRSRAVKPRQIVLGFFLLGLLILAKVIQDRQESAADPAPAGKETASDATAGGSAPSSPAPRTPNSSVRAPATVRPTPNPAPESASRRERSQHPNPVARTTAREHTNALAPAYHAEARGWTRLSGCTLVEDRFNDGDNVVARHRTEDGNSLTNSVFRLYFVDTPESRDKPFADHRRRVEDQGQDLGGLGYEETLALGRRAKARVPELLAQPFTVWTRWQEVYESERYFALIQTADGQWLHELLVREGLARVHTEGTDLPDGTDRRSAEAELRSGQHNPR